MTLSLRNKYLIQSQKETVHYFFMILLLHLISETAILHVSQWLFFSPVVSLTVILVFYLDLFHKKIATDFYSQFRLSDFSIYAIST